jgi:hypothetical protein
MAQAHLIEYLAFFIKSRDYHMFPPLVHFATHVVEDVARHGCGAGHLSAYAFENQLSVFGKVRNVQAQYTHVRGLVVTRDN